MKLQELITAIADPRVTPRFVRFLIAETVIPPPTGGRTYADYGPYHVDAIRRYLRLRDFGLSIAAIRRLDERAAPDSVAIQIAAGLTLQVNPADIASLPTPEVLAGSIRQALADLEPLAKNNATNHPQRTA